MSVAYTSDTVDAGVGMDIVERLRDTAYATPNEVWRFEGLITDAADEIERLRLHVDMQTEFVKANEDLGLEVTRLRALVNGDKRYAAVFSPEDIGLVKVNNNSNVNWPWYRYPVPDDAVF